MRRERRGPAAALAVAALATLLFALDLPAAKFTPGQDAYMRGAQAWLADDFATVVKSMRLALQEDREEGLQKFQYKGLNKEDYLPHLFLGLALEKLGEKDAALASLRESRRQGVVLTSPANRRLLERALQRLEPPPTAAPAPTPTAVPAVPTPRPAAPPPSPTGALAGPSPTRPPFPSPAATRAETRPTPPPLTAATPIPQPTAAPAPTPGVEAQALNAVVRQGIKLYFAGDFDGAMRALEPVRTLRPAARLFTAYCLASKAVLASPPDPDLRKRAVSEFAQARAEGVDPLPSALLSRPVREVLGLP